MTGSEASAVKPGARLAADAIVHITLMLNGAKRSGLAEPRMLLTDFLRHILGATGTHVGCEHGVCGACTIRLDGEAVRACLTLAVQADGRRVDTVEGLAKDGKLNDLQTGFRKHHALQCGFCTAGILMSLDHFLELNAAPSEFELRAMLSGHLCRCTGYTPIIKAALEVARTRVRLAASDGGELEGAEAKSEVSDKEDLRYPDTPAAAVPQ